MSRPLRFKDYAVAILFATILLTGFNGTVAFAQSSGETLVAEPDEGNEQRRERQSRVDRRGAVQLVSEFDEDGSRSLDVFELAAAIRERREQRRTEREDESGEESRPATGERPPSPREVAAKLLEEFDRNEDGELSGLEIARMLEELRRRQAERREESEEEADDGGEEPTEERRPPRRRERDTDGDEGDRDERPVERPRGDRRDQRPEERREREDETGERTYPLPRPF